MPHVRSITTVGLLVALGALPTMPVGQVVAQVQVIESAPMEVTTDKPEYCMYLLDRVSELVRVATEPVPHEVADLTTEGHRMCNHGQVRSGILRLRSAIMIMEKSHGTAY